MMPLTSSGVHSAAEYIKDGTWQLKVAISIERIIIMSDIPIHEPVGNDTENWTSLSNKEAHIRAKAVSIAT
jgi:hypothetical protein